MFLSCLRPLWQELSFKRDDLADRMRWAICGTHPSILAKKCQNRQGRPLAWHWREGGWQEPSFKRDKPEPANCLVFFWSPHFLILSGFPMPGTVVQARRAGRPDAVGDPQRRHAPRRQAHCRGGGRGDLYIFINK